MQMQQAVGEQHDVVGRADLAAIVDFFRGLIEDFEEKFANPYKAAALGYLDDVIEPNQTRERLCKALGMLLDKEELRPARKHGNIPL